MNEVIDFHKLRMKTLYISIPELIYNEMWRRGMIKKVNEIVVNHFIDILDDDNNEDCQELRGMTKKRFN